MDVKFDFLDTSKQSIPFPSTDHLRKIKKIENKNERNLIKHEREYDAYCQWRAMPEQIRDPKTANTFEKKWKIPEGYSQNFQRRTDFRDKVLRYFWDWMMDSFPNVVYAVYKKAKDGNAPHAKIFAELISKHLEADKPKQLIQPFMLIGVPQEKIDNLFIPQDMNKIEDIVPESEGQIP